jgi:hypothetical protein
LHQFAVVTVSSCNSYSQRYTSTVGEQAPLGAALAPVRGVGTCARLDCLAAPIFSPTELWSLLRPSLATPTGYPSARCTEAALLATVPRTDRPLAAPENGHALWSGHPTNEEGRSTAAGSQKVEDGVHRLPVAHARSAQLLLGLGFRQQRLDLSPHLSWYPVFRSNSVIWVLALHHLRTLYGILFVLLQVYNVELFNFSDGFLVA